MCGIAGVAGRRVDSSVLKAMGIVLRHRGPDQGVESSWDDGGFAFRRLSIIDVAGGQQPLTTEDGSVVMILNGEIYNHHQLRDGLVARGHRFRTHSDAEVALHLWEEKGPDCVNDLHGMFALAIWDNRQRQLFLARDRVGKKPLYYYSFEDGSIAFASEIKALLQHPDIPREPDLGSIDQFLMLQYVPSPRTAFLGIRRLAPAHWLIWREGRTIMERYWQLTYTNDVGRATEAELAEEALHLLRKAVSIRLESEVPLGALLSGGLDSGAVVALASQARSQRLSTFTVGFADPTLDESAQAETVARRFGTDHHLLRLETPPPELVDDIVWHYDQPFGDPSAIPSMQIAKMTRQHVTVVLNGDGGDESFAGYDRYRLAAFHRFFNLPHWTRDVAFTLAGPIARLFGRGARLIEVAPATLEEAYLASLEHLWPQLRASLYTVGMFDSLPANRPAPLDEMSRTRTALDPLATMLRTDVHHYLPDDLLVKMDVATMAASLEARSPFLDQDLMEFMARLPSRYKMRRGVSKVLLKKAMTGILPDEVVKGRKRGFGVPLANWLRGPYRTRLEDTLHSAGAVGRGYFQQPVVNRLLDDLMSGRNRYQYVLWDLLILESWHRKFIDSGTAPDTH